MAQNTNIEWAQATLNAIVGCRKCSSGCDHCYAIKETWRLKSNPHPNVAAKFLPVVSNARGAVNWTGEVTFTESALLDVIRRRTPTRYFVNSLSDLFYDGVEDEWIDKHFATFALCPQHQFLVLTKRPQRMRDYANNPGSRFRIGDEILGYCKDTDIAQLMYDGVLNGAGERDWETEEKCPSLEGKNWLKKWPLPNVWLGVSCEDQKTADERIPLLLESPAAVRWISAEPLLGPVDLTHIQFPNALGNEEEWNAIDRCVMANGMDDPTLVGVDDPILDWIVVGGESGPGARPCDISNIRSIVEQCKAAGVPCFVKQLGADPVDWRHDEPEVPPYEFHLEDRKGGDINEWPEDLRVREFPEVA